MRKNQVFDGQGNIVSDEEIPYTTNELTAYLENYRYEREVEGYEYVIGGTTYRFHTDRLSRSTWRELLEDAKAAENDDVVIHPAYKDMNKNFASLTAGAIKAIHAGGRAKVAKLFIAEEAVAANLSDYSTLDAIKTAFEGAYDAL